MDSIIKELDEGMADEKPISIEEVLEEPEAAEPTGLTPREELEARARALGVAFRSTISDANLLVRVEEAEAAAQTSEVTPEVTPEVTEGVYISEQTRLEMEAGAAWVARQANAGA
jgi:hypothetical protein